MFQNGLVYKGEYTDNHKSKGTVYDNQLTKKIYEGEWLEDMYHGKGKLSCEEGNVYEGEFYQGMFQGEGKLIWENGDVYTGQFKEHMKHGQGHLIFQNGDEYKGQFY